MKIEKLLLPGKNNFLSVLAVIGISIFIMVFLLACSKGKSDQQMKQPAVPVTVDSVVKKTVPVQIRAIGNVEAYSTVAVKARVGGELKNVYFREGQDVNKGQLLFLIDPQPYETALNAAQANLARDTALAKKTEDDLVRYSELLKEELVSRDKYEQVYANAEAMKATLRADIAAVENARLQLSYCSVYAPISGRTGSLLVNEGNLIKANDDKPLVVINQIKPVYVTFSVPGQYLPEIKMHMKSGKLSVEAFASMEDKNPFRGLLTFVDNTVDAATGTIKMKATFENKEKSLWPGQFVTVRITLSTIQDAVVVSSNAVQTGQQGQFAFVVKNDTAELRMVTAGITYEDITVIEKGLEPGDQVVTDGQMRLMPGAKVEIRKPQGAKGIEQNQKPEAPAKDKTK